MLRSSILLSLALLAAPAFAAEPCLTKGVETARAVPLDPAHPSDLLVSIPTVIKLHGLTSASLAAFPPSCGRGGFTAGGRAYVLTGENGDPNAPRRAAASDPKAPVAFLAEVFDLGAALAAPAGPGGEPRATETRYVLATALNDVMVVWRAYDAVPDDARLKADMAAALSGRATPVMRFDMKGGSVQVLTP